MFPNPGCSLLPRCKSGSSPCFAPGSSCQSEEGTGSHVVWRMAKRSRTGWLGEHLGAEGYSSLLSGFLGEIHKPARAGLGPRNQTQKERLEGLHRVEGKETQRRKGYREETQEHGVGRESQVGAQGVSWASAEDSQGSWAAAP